METIDYDQLAAAQAAADEIREPGITARRAAAREHERIVREARATTERQYRELLTTIVQGQQPDPVELTRLATALGRSEPDITADVEQREAELADEAEVQRAKDIKEELEQQIVDLKEQAKEFATIANNTHKTCRELTVEIERQHAQVAIKEKAAYKTALQENRHALEEHENVTEDIQVLQNLLQEVRPRCNHVERLRQKHWQKIHEARERESDRAMAPYVFATQQNELPDETLRAALNPPAPAGPPIQQLVGLGKIDGKDVVVSVSGKLG